MAKKKSDDPVRDAVEEMSPLPEFDEEWVRGHPAFKREMAAYGRQTATHFDGGPQDNLTALIIRIILSILRSL